MDFQTIDHKWLYKEVVLQLENYIKENHLKIGDQLPTERYLAERLGISRGTVREAFRTLEVNGVIESRPGGGRFLKTDLNQHTFLKDVATELDHAAAKDLLELRELIELKQLELVIDRGTEEDFANIEEALNSSEDDYERDSAFHLALAEASHNNAFYLVNKYIMSLLADVRKNYIKRPNRHQEIRHEHAALLDAIKNRDQISAQELMLQHLHTLDVHYDDHKL